MDDNITSLNMNVLDDCMNKWPDESWRGVSPPLIRLLMTSLFLTKVTQDTRPIRDQKKRRNGMHEGEE